MYFDNNVNCCFVLDLLHRMKSIDLMSLIHTRMLYNCLRTSIYVEHVIDLPLKSKSPLFTGCRLQTRCTNWLNMSGMANLQLKLSVHDPPPLLSQSACSSHTRSSWVPCCYPGSRGWRFSAGRFRSVTTSFLALLFCYINSTKLIKCK